MKVNFTKKLRNIDGKPIKDKDGTITLSSISINALLAQTKEEVEGKEKVEQYDLALKIRDNKDADLTVEEIAKIKELVGKIFPPLIVGQTFKMLDK